MEQYIPDIYQENIHTIDFKKLWNRGIHCLLFDLDNTLVPYSMKIPPEELITFFAKLKEKGFRSFLFSNSPKCRVNRFKQVLQLDGVACANKPSPKKFLNLLQLNKLEPTEVAIIGDQMMTDIKGGNLAGITTILIEPISKVEPFWAKPNRLREKRIRKKLQDHDLFFQGRYYE